MNREVDFFLTGAFLGAAFLAGTFLAAVFLAGTFLAGAFFAVGFLTAFFAVFTGFFETFRFTATILNSINC
ncbi:MAG TPA: hypothetical protein QGG93_07445 [Verrucomicrobiota bacterium]|nr:hypothetical protein [Verrucomicrobiota bacterium]